MKSVQLALASALIGILGLWQPVSAQPSDQSGGRGSNQTDPNPNKPNEEHGPGWMHRGMMMEHRGMMEHGGMMGRPSMMGGSRNAGAHFHISSGNASIDIQCPADQAVERCVRAAGDLIDKVMSMKQSGAAVNPIPGQTPPPSQQ